MVFYHNSLQDKKITVFGGTGFIGRHLVKMLAARGAQVCVPTRCVKDAKPLCVSGDVGQITPVAIDLLSDSSLSYILDGCDGVINLIGILYQTRRQKFDDIHHKLPAKLAHAAQQAGCSSFVHVSALGAAPDSNSAYARSKYQGERAVLDIMPSAHIIRPSIIFGPDDDFFNLFARLAMVSPILPLIGGGKTKFQPIYVGDVAKAIMTCLNFAPTNHHIYELGGPSTYSFKDLLQIMLSEMEKKRILMPVPFWAAWIKALFLELLPRPLITRDQVKLLKSDNIVSGHQPGLKDLAIAPTSLEVILPTYLSRFKDGNVSALSY